MIVIVDWTSRNTARLTHLRKVRLGRGLDPMAPAVLDGYTAASSPSKAMLDFAARVTLRYAEAFWQRINEYCATHAAQTGEIRVPRAEFGRVVLSRGLDPVGQGLGERVYDALLESKLAKPITDGVGAALVPSQRPSRDGTRRGAVTAQGAAGDGTTTPAVPSQTPSGDGTSGPAVTAQAPSCDGTDPPAVTAQVGASRALARAADAQRRRNAGATQAPGACEETSLEGPSCDGTSAAPDQTRPELHESSRGSTSDEAWLLREVRAVTWDAEDQRRARALTLWNARRDSAAEWWRDHAERLLREPRTATAKAVGMVASA